MKAIILAGGLGSRLAEETVLRPKPMVELGGKPITLSVLCSPRMWLWRSSTRSVCHVAPR